MIIPLITTPYVSRVLSPEGIGTNAYTNSIIQYVIMIITLGIPFYASREIAYQRDDKDKLSRCFWEIYIVQFSLGLLSFIACIMLFNKLVIFNKYKFILLIQTIGILSAVFDVSWFFYGIENFKTTIKRNIITKIIGVLCIFLFVKSSNDLYKYVLINVMFSLLGQIVIWKALFTMINSPFRYKLNIKNIIIHLQSSIIKFFIPQVAVSIYTILDRIMLGMISNMNEVAYYDQSQKIVKMVLAIVTSLGSVMLPRMSNLYKNGEKEKLNDYFLKSLTFTIAITIPLVAGIIGTAPEFVSWFFGEKFLEIIPLMQLFAPIILIISLNNVFGLQYLIPIGKNIGYTAGICLAAVMNIILNFVLIPRYGAFGSTISTVIAELTADLVMLYFINKFFRLSLMFKGVIRYILSGVIMLIFIRLIGLLIHVKVVITIIQIIVGISIYFFCLILLRERFIINTSYLYIKSKLGRRPPRKAPWEM